MSDWTKLSRSLRKQLMLLGSFIVVIWLLEAADLVLFHSSLDRLGIQPRSLLGLRGIPLAPFLHAGFGHVFANTIPFLVLGWFVMLRGFGEFWTVTVIAVFVSGMGVWLIGSPRSTHFGASGLVFGFFGYLLLRGYFERSLSSILWSVLVIMLYGGMLFSILPQGTSVSWQAHLFGLIGGGIAAYSLSRNDKSAGELEL